jgi:molecular chaperone GrpE
VKSISRSSVFSGCDKENVFIELQYNKYDDRPMAHETEEVKLESIQETKEESLPETVSPSFEELQREYQDLNDRFLRLAADFENFRKRTARDLEAQVKFALEEFASELLEVIDNFERAEKAEDSGAKEGLVQIHKLFRAVLERHGIRPIESVGKPFDPTLHEAIVTLPSEGNEGIVVEEFCPGYCMHDRVIRCAKVAVSKGKEGT